MDERYNRVITELVCLRKQMRDLVHRVGRQTANDAYVHVPRPELVQLNAEFLALARTYRQVETGADELAAGLGNLGGTSLRAARTATDEAWGKLCLLWAPLAGRLVESLAVEPQNVT